MGSFKDVVGHKDIINYIRSAVEKDQVSHAYILNGERGAGKKLLANLFAASLQCEKGGPDPCNNCHSCRQAESGNHPDIIRVTHEKPNSISVDDIREQVNNTIMIKPYQGPYKIYIIDRADLMTVQAQNALLKTIEEPPQYAVIMLLTENAELLLPTITSRCVMLKLRYIRDKLIRRYLMEKVCQVLEEQEKKTGSAERMNEFLRVAVLSAVDDAWVEQVDYMQQLQAAVSGRATAQRNPLFEYQNESFASFRKMKNTVYENAMRSILLSDIFVDTEGKLHILFP